MEKLLVAYCLGEGTWWTMRGSVYFDTKADSLDRAKALALAALEKDIGRNVNPEEVEHKAFGDFLEARVASYPIDDEPLNQDDIEAIAEARGDSRSHTREQILRMVNEGLTEEEMDRLLEENVREFQAKKRKAEVD